MNAILGKDKRVSLAVAATYLLPLIFSIGCVSSPSGQVVTTKHIWFDNISGGSEQSSAARKKLVRLAGTAILKGGSFRADPPGWDASQRPQIVFLSISDGVSPARVIHAAGRGDHATVRRAVQKARTFVKEAGYTPRWVKVDFVQGVTDPTRVSATRRLTLPPSVWGLSFPAASRVAFLPEELAARQLIDSHGHLRPGRIVSYLRVRNGPVATARKLFSQGGFEVRRFRTDAFFFGGEDVVSLRNGHQRVDRVTPGSLLEGAQAGGRYLVRSTRDDGRFDYVYDPLTGSVPDTYNIVRHAGTVYAMSELLRVSPTDDLARATSRALRCLLAQVKKCRSEGQEGQYVVWDGTVKLGANALAVLAIAEHSKATGTKSHLETARDLARWMVSVQAESGRFQVHKQTHPDGRPSTFRSAYYPGEAIFALVRLHQLSGNQDWIDAAELAARYLIQVRDHGKSAEELPPDHWLLYGLERLHRERPHDMYRRHAQKLALSITRGQATAPPRPDWRGGYRFPPASAPTATKTEGLCAAYQLLRRSRDRDIRATILRAARLGTRFQLRTQLGPWSAMYYPTPRRGIGGFTYTLTDKRIRIDVVQHNISAFLALRRILRTR